MDLGNLFDSSTYGLLYINLVSILLVTGSTTTSRVEIKSYSEAQRLQDDAAERCSITYRAPEFFNIQSPSSFDERTDIWVNIFVYI